jgi:hypothetical protein
VGGKASCGLFLAASSCGTQIPRGTVLVQDVVLYMSCTFCTGQRHNIPSVLHEFLLYVGGRRPFPAQCSQRRRGRTVAARSAARITSHYGCCQPSSQVPLARSPEATGRWIVRLEQLFLRAMPCCGQAPPHRPPSQPMANGRGPSSRAHPGNPLSLPAAASIRLLPYGAMYAAKVATQPGVPALPESDTRSLCS